MSKVPIGEALALLAEERQVCEEISHVEQPEDAQAADWYADWVSMQEERWDDWDDFEDVNDYDRESFDVELQENATDEKEGDDVREEVS